MTRKTLSATIINYNHSQYLHQSIAAMCTQSRPPDEFIIVDDGSTDNSLDIIHEFAKKYSFMTVVEHGTNKGLFAAVDSALSASTGDYLFCGASDDYVLPGFFEKSMAISEEFPDAGICSSFFSIRYEPDGMIQNGDTGWCDRPRFFTPDDVAAIPGLHGLPGHASILNRRAFDAAGGYMPDLLWACDWFSSLVLAFRHGMCYVPESLSIFRSVPNSYSATRKSDPVLRRQVNSLLRSKLSSADFADVAPLFHRSGVLRGQQ